MNSVFKMVSYGTPVFIVWVWVFCFLFLFIYLFIYLFLAVLGLRFCARAFSSCGKWGPLFIAVRRPLTIAASLVAEHRLQMRRLSSCGSRAQLLRGMWDPPRPGLEPTSPALAGRFSTTAPPGKPRPYLLMEEVAKHLWPLIINHNSQQPLFWLLNHLKVGWIKQTTFWWHEWY